VLLVENNRLLRDGMAAMLSDRGIRVVAAVQHGAEAMRQLSHHKPQVVLLDSALGDCDTIAFVDSLRAAAPDSRLVVMGLLPVHEEVVAFVRAGVSGFLLKSATIEEFVRTIEDVAAGAHVLPPPLMGALFTHVAAQALGRGRRGARAAVRMTKREREVIGAIGDGLGNKEIASRLSIASHTVKSHVHNILEKLALHTRLEVAAYAHANKPVRAAS
jgi:DNA-binding NarL/FixJ family response regulator